LPADDYGFKEEHIEIKILIIKLKMGGKKLL
jgi:hypothetical protein